MVEVWGTTKRNGHLGKRKASQCSSEAEANWKSYLTTVIKEGSSAEQKQLSSK